MSTWSIFGLAFALSLDGFAAAVAYGLKRIRVPFFSLLIICLCSTAAMAVALLAGKGLSTFLPEAWIGNLGGAILIFLGLFQIYNSKRKKQIGKDKEQAEEVPPTKSTDLPVNASARITETAGERERVFSLTLPPFGW
ncbi:manganese efflux pump [Heliorestis convoluta]|uniref:Sporulation membrane protein YtaF n=1 Tax=Heliorestis convoluta TaxID=356322 RepID=A0A5Q2N432_9FIRM|nr:manganese efflux pump [Heliorestis convoluta]QGG49081.1 sporulation membrane protein YtaF [Heliorestis convoluta]